MGLRRFGALRPAAMIKLRHCSAVLSFGLIFLIPSQRLAAEDAESSVKATLSPGSRFVEASGAELFAGICQGCHMSDGKGATGAGNYPSLANDKNLEAKEYPLYIVVRGQRAMPPIGSVMSDGQVAAVINYLRTHFGNQYQDAVTAEDVRTVRP
jgi:mono/diheme cytochrome c family protein